MTFSNDFLWCSSQCWCRSFCNNSLNRLVTSVSLGKNPCHIQKVFVFLSYQLVLKLSLLLWSCYHLVQFLLLRSCNQDISIHQHWICICPSSLSMQFSLLSLMMQWDFCYDLLYSCPKSKNISICFNTNYIYEASIYDSMKHFLCWMYTNGKSQELVSSKGSVHYCQFGTLFIQRYLPISFLCI